ncbi:hypothetical protein BH11CYA1_BH11CYA1_10470 [soil metagenome]
MSFRLTFVRSILLACSSFLTTSAAFATDQYGLSASDGKTILPCKYGGIRHQSNGKFIVTPLLDGKADRLSF